MQGTQTAVQQCMQQEQSGTNGVPVSRTYDRRSPSSHFLLGSLLLRRTARLVWGPRTSSGSPPAAAGALEGEGPPVDSSSSSAAGPPYTHYVAARTEATLFEHADTCMDVVPVVLEGFWVLTKCISTRCCCKSSCAVSKCLRMQRQTNKPSSMHTVCH